MELLWRMMSESSVTLYVRDVCASQYAAWIGVIHKKSITKQSDLPKCTGDVALQSVLYFNDLVFKRPSQRVAKWVREALGPNLRLRRTLRNLCEKFPP